MSSESVGVNETIFESSVLHSLLIPDYLSPGQYADQHRSNECSPDRRMYLAVLEDAVDCWLRGGNGVTKSTTIKRAVEAESWIRGDGALVTFVDCCEILGFSPDWLRKKLETMREKRPIKIPRARPVTRTMPGEAREASNNIAIAAAIIKRSQEKSHEIVHPRIERICPPGRLAASDGAGDSDVQGTLPGFGSGSEAAVRGELAVESYVVHLCRAAGEDV